MKNALHLPVIVLAILYMHLTAQAQSDSDAVYVETPVKSAIQETPRSVPPTQTGLADACGYPIAIRLIGTAGRYYQQMGWAEKFNRFRWEYHLVSGEGSNCFALPDGKIAVFDHLARSVNSAGELAYVIGHAIGHVLSGHQPRNRKREAPSQSPFSARAWSGMENFERLALGLDPAYRNADEQEADRISLTLMRLAGFDLDESLLFWDNLQQRTGQATQPPGVEKKGLNTRKKSLHDMIAEITVRLKPLPVEETEDQHAGWIPCPGLHNKSDVSAPPPAEPIAAPPPATGAFIFVLVDVAPSAGIQRNKIVPLETLGTVYLDEISVEGLNYTRILLGDCVDIPSAKQLHTKVKALGFGKAEMVEYKNGKRIRTLY